MKFRRRLRDAGLHDTHSEAVVEHIKRQGLLVKSGTMVDATIIEVSRGRPRPGGTADAMLPKQEVRGPVSGGEGRLT
jgi:xanthine/CO dehydrogenase XdhC/CoxF family maturation factor